jgi:FKBP-type peptidyl-prolyl cis-trans isomerase FklB
MLKLLSSGVNVLAAGVILLGSAMAQQSANPQSAPAAKTSPAAKTAPAASSGEAALPTQKDKLSYALGMNIGKGLHKDSVDINPNLLMRGLKDAMAGGATLMTDEQAQATIMELQGQLRAKLETQRKAAEATNKKDGEAFLAANKTKPGVVTLPSGLQYKILKAGTGPKPTPSDSVECNYKGTLVNGTEFDSSYKRGQPATFPVTGVIKGWTEALQLMPVGSKWQLVLPPDLAYGARGAGDAIGPDETLIFEVELLSIAKKDQPPAQK